jgi:hypothetical protein
MIFKIFSRKKIAKKLAFLTQNKAKLCKFLITTLDFEKRVNFFAENWQKSQKNVIITSTPGAEFVNLRFGRNVLGHFLNPWLYVRCDVQVQVAECKVVER